MRESVLEAAVVAYAKERGCLCYKFASPSNRGVPDRIIISPKGRTGFLELKQFGKKPTALQLSVIAKLRAQGAPAGWADNLITARRFIDELL